MDYLTALKQFSANQKAQEIIQNNENVPRDLKWLRNLKMSEDDIQKLLAEPNERKEGEAMERYKIRRKIRNALIKYKNIL
jgi:hypothetical protein